MFDSPDLSRRLDCGGALISSKHILTSIRCVDFDSYPDYILLGDTVTGVDDATIEIIEVTNYILHDDFSVNIAILEMAEPAPLDKFPNMKPVCLPEVEADFSHFEGTVTGWAYNGINGYNSWLHEHNVTITADKDCNKAQICGNTSGHKYNCYGDTGGPLIVSDPANNYGLTLVGIVDNNDCDSVQTFTKVSLYVEWIRSVIHDANNCPPLP